MKYLLFLALLSCTGCMAASSSRPLSPDRERAEPVHQVEAADSTTSPG